MKSLIDILEFEFPSLFCSILCVMRLNDGKAQTKKH